jgi:phosphatidylglycerophosphatase A
MPRPKRKEWMQGSAAFPKTQGPVRPWPEVFAASRVTTLIATWFGVGFLPIAPGTWGSLCAIPFAHAIFSSCGVWGLGSFALAVTVIGIHAAGETVRLRGIGDPPEVVVDEVAGQSIALLPVYALVPPEATLVRIGAVLSAFVVFRVLDVWKPGPIGALERLPGGWGVMADDVLGGAFAGALIGAALLLTR